MVRGGSAENVLVVGVERLSDFTSRDDRGTAFIFGDGAGAAVVGPSEHPRHRPDGLGLRRRPVASHLADRELDRRPRAEARLAAHRHGRARPCSAGPCGAWRPSRSRRSTPPASPSTSSTRSSPTRPTCGSSTRWPRSCKLPEGVAIARDIHYTGNTSAASVPLAMERMVREGEAPSGGLALQIGFGAGLSFAAQVVVIP